MTGRQKTVIVYKSVNNHAPVSFQNYHHAVSKTVHKEFRNGIITSPTAQLKYDRQFENDELDRKKIYGLPHRVALDTKTRKFQYKLLNRCLPTNVFLNKIGIIASPACWFCGEADESLGHFFVTCHYTKKFWGEVIKWLGDQDIEITSLSNKGLMFGIIDDQENSQKNIYIFL